MPECFTPDVFGFTPFERTNYQLSHERFLDHFHAPDFTLHQVKLADNGRGEYLSVTLSHQHQAITFYGLGYHIHRHTWIKDFWFWSPHHPIDSLYRQSIPKDEALAQIETRRANIPELEQKHPDNFAILFGWFSELNRE